MLIMCSLRYRLSLAFSVVSDVACPVSSSAISILAAFYRRWSMLVWCNVASLNQMLLAWNVLIVLQVALLEISLCHRRRLMQLFLPSLAFKTLTSRRQARQISLANRVLHGLVPRHVLLATTGWRTLADHLGDSSLVLRSSDSARLPRPRKNCL